MFECAGGVTTGGQCRAFSPFSGAEAWTTEGAVGGVAHVFHDAFWGNWQVQKTQPTPAPSSRNPRVYIYHYATLLTLDTHMSGTLVVV
jgi:hypothetical protein